MSTPIAAGAVVTLRGGGKRLTVLHTANREAVVAWFEPHNGGAFGMSMGEVMQRLVVSFDALVVIDPAPEPVKPPTPVPEPGTVN